MKTRSGQAVFLLGLSGALLVLTLLGCVTPNARGFTRYLGYEGRQQRWPRSTSALTELDYSIPAYLGLPARPYQVIGFVINSEPTFRGKGLPGWLWTDKTRLANACNQARAHGADAILLTNDEKVLNAFNNQPGSAARSNRLLADSDGHVVAIKWADSR